MHKKMLLTFGYLSFFAAYAGNAPDARQQSTIEAYKTRKHETPKIVVHKILLDLNPYQVIGKIESYYAFESKNELLQKAHAILEKANCIIENYSGENTYPSIKTIEASADKIVALYMAKTLVERYEQIKGLR